jgi:hypothetical protein
MVVIDAEEVIEQPAAGANHTRIPSVVDSQDKPQISERSGSLALIKANIKRLQGIDWGSIDSSQIDALADALDDLVWEAQFATTPDHVFQSMQDEVDAEIASGTTRETFDDKGNFIEP